jgi:hypothetical protein
LLGQGKVHLPGIPEVIEFELPAGTATVGIIVAARGSSEPVTYFLLRGSLLTVSTISRVVVIGLNQP